MAEKPNTFATPAVKSKTNFKRSLAASTARKAPASSAIKRPPPPNVDLNATRAFDPDSTLLNCTTAGGQNFEAELNQIAYGKFLRALLQDITLEEKFEREEKILDVQMTQLADRFQKTVDQLDKTNKRLKDIKFIIEQKRLMDLKSNDCTQFYKATDESGVYDQLQNLATAQDDYLDRIVTKNVDFGYNKESGHKQLLDAVDEALEGLETIKKQSNLDMKTFEDFKETEKILDDIDKTRCNLESLRCEFMEKFPTYGDKVIKQITEKVKGLMQDDQKLDEA